MHTVKTQRVRVLLIKSTTSNAQRKGHYVKSPRCRILRKSLFVEGITKRTLGVWYLYVESTAKRALGLGHHYVQDTT